MAFGLGFLALLAVFFESAAEAVTLWYTDATYNHGFLILPICGYLVWLRRDALARLSPTPTYWGVLALAAISLVWLVAHFASIRVVQQLALVGMIQMLFLTVMGWRIAKFLVFPLFYLVFLVPVGDFLVPPLQDFTAFFVVQWLQLVGVPVFLDGIFISIPEGNFEVAEACAGVRFLIATVALSFLFAHLTYHSYWRKTAFLALGLIVPIIANGFRAFGIVLVGHLSDMTIAVGIDHIIYGWLFFAIVTVLLLAIGMTFRDREVAAPPPAPDTAPGRAAPPRALASAAIVAALAACIAPSYAYVVTTAPAPPLARAIDPPPSASWSVSPTYADSWRPVFPGADRTMLRSYAKDGKRVDMFIGYFARQRQGAEIISYRNAFADDKLWQRAGSGTIRADLAGQTMRMERTRVRTFRRARVVWNWYWVDGTFTADRMTAKLLQVRAQMLARGSEAAVIAVATDYADQPGEADAVLAQFLAEIGPIEPSLARVAR